MKLVGAEEHSPALRSWLDERPRDHPITSVLAEVEVWRAVRRRAPELLSAVPPVFARISLIEVSAAVRDIAANAGDTQLRTLDAIHLATAVLVRSELVALVSYDTRLLDGARAAGLAILTPR